MGVSGPFKFIWDRFNRTIINNIWPELWFFTAWATMVVVVNKYAWDKFNISNQLLTVLGTVLGLVISFRTTSAYDKFWEGRKLWGSIALASRSLGMIIWIHVPLDRKARPGREQSDRPDGQLRSIIEKKTMMNLIQAFSVAVKHYLRSEPGIYYEDLYPLVSFLPQSIEDLGATQDRDLKVDPNSCLPMWTDSPPNTLHVHASHHRKKHHKDFDPEKVLPKIISSVPLRPARNPPPETFTDKIPFLVVFKPLTHLIKRAFGVVGNVQNDGARTMFGKKRDLPPIDSNVPLEICLFLSSYLQMLLAEGLLTPAMATGYNNALVSLQDAVTNLARIRTTPIPFAYQTHLRASVWLYLLFLPFEIYTSFHWLTIPCMLFTAFLYLGFLDIGQEIENPFNYDKNDLDLDHFCLQIQRELAEITAHPAPDPWSYIFSAWNQPFAPADRRNAVEMLQQRQQAPEGSLEANVIHGVRQVLLRSYSEIATATYHDSDQTTWFRR